MSARLFCYTKKVSTRLSRACSRLLLTLVLIATVAGSVTPAFASTKYNEYKYLFGRIDPSNPGVNLPGYFGNTSTFSYAGPLIDKENKNNVDFIDGLWFKFSFQFKDAEKSWKHIAPDGSDRIDAFIVRNCDANPENLDANGNIQEQYCLYSRVVYVYNPTLSGLDKIGKYSAQYFSFLLTEAGGIFGAVFGFYFGKEVEKKYDIKLQKKDDKTFIIYRKDKDADWIKEESVDLLQGLGSKEYQWFEIEPSGTITYQPKLKPKPGDTRSASLWYCGVPYEGLDPTDAHSLDPQNDADVIKQFGNLCGGGSYFRISSETRFTLAKTFSEAQQQFDAITPEKPNKKAEKPTLPGCDFFGGTWLTGDGSFMGCMAQFFYYAVYSPIAWFAGTMGNLFDFFLGYAISDEAYRAEFVVSAWRIVRDISNIFFILILVWTGLMAVFNTDAISMRKVVPQLILNALLINFSLFGTRVVVDISNIVSRLFYNIVTIQRVSETGEVISADNQGPAGYKPLSEKIVSGFDPQKIFAARNTSIEKYNAKILNDRLTDVGLGGKSKKDKVQYVDRNKGDYATYYLLVSILAAAIMLAIGIMFWKTAFLFLGRVVGIYIVMIFSPFAVLSRGNMPIIGNIERLKWNDWWKELSNYALIAPIFIFFLYVVYLFVDSGFINTGIQDLETGSFFEVLLWVAIPLLIVYFILQQGVAIAKKYAGIVGALVQEKVNSFAGFAGGVALGATGLVGARVIGGAAKLFDESRAGSWVRDQAKKSGITGWVARRAQEGVNATRAGSFDVRQSLLGNKLFTAMGVSTNQKGLDTLKGVGLGFSVEQRKGGFDADVKRRQEAKENTEKLLNEKMDDDKRRAYNKRQKDEYEKKVATIVEESAFGGMTLKSIKTEIKKLEQRSDEAGKKELEKKQKEYDAEKAEILKVDTAARTAISNLKQPKELKSVSEINSARRESYAENLKKRNLWDKTIGRIPIVGAVSGTDVRVSGDKKAAKKIEEKNKAEKELVKIESILEKGFKDLIAVELFQKSKSFTSLPLPERKQILEGKKSMYDILSANEKMVIDTQRKTLGKKQEDEYLDLVKVREQTRYDTKDLNKEIKTARTDWETSGGDEKKYKKWRDLLKKRRDAEKQQEIFRNLNEYIKKQKDKLKDEGK